MLVLSIRYGIQGLLTNIIFHSSSICDYQLFPIKALYVVNTKDVMGGESGFGGVKDYEKQLINNRG